MRHSDREEKQTLSRRDALKTLAAATGAIALSNLPKTWKTPVIEAGALPAHAQASVVTTSLTISNPRGSNTGVNNCTVLTVGIGSSFDLVFDYNDTSGNVTSSSDVLYKTSTNIAPGTPVNEIPLSSSFVEINGNQSSGTITIPWCQVFGIGGDTVDFEFQLRNDQDTVSNTVGLTITRPVGGNSESQVMGGAS